MSDYVRYFLDQHRMEYGQPPKARGPLAPARTPRIRISLQLRLGRSCPAPLGPPRLPGAVAARRLHVLEAAHRAGRRPPPSQVATAANLFQMLCYQNKNMLTAGIIVAG